MKEALRIIEDKKVNKVLLWKLMEKYDSLDKYNSMKYFLFNEKLKSIDGEEMYLLEHTYRTNEAFRKLMKEE